MYVDVTDKIAWMMPECVEQLINLRVEHHLEAIPALIVEAPRLGMMRDSDPRSETL